MVGPAVSPHVDGSLNHRSRNRGARIRHFLLGSAHYAARSRIDSNEYTHRRDRNWWPVSLFAESDLLVDDPSSDRRRGVDHELMVLRPRRHFSWALDVGRDLARGAISRAEVQQ